MCFLQRACILFLLGLMLNSMGGSTLENMRVFGVLQRFAIAYFVITVLYIYLTRRCYGHPEVRLECNMCLVNTAFWEWMYTCIMKVAMLLNFSLVIRLESSISHFMLDLSLHLAGHQLDKTSKILLP